MGTATLPPGVDRGLSRAVPNVVAPATLLAVSAGAWWWSVRAAGSMQAMSFASFCVAWVAMMAAMMLPAVLPVVRLYALAAAKGRAAPLPFFVASYLIVWGALAVPAYFAWVHLSQPMMGVNVTAARVAGASLLLAAAYQLTPLKTACLRHCQSPLSVFLRAGRKPETPVGALRMGGRHALYCLGCCWALMAALVAVGAMNVYWMVGLTGLIFAEKVLPRGMTLSRVVAPAIAALGVLLLVDPMAITNLT